MSSTHKSASYAETICFLNNMAAAYPHPCWVEWDRAIPAQLEYHEISSQGGYVCGICDDKTNVYMFKQLHVYDANVLAGAIPGLPPHIPGFHSIPGVPGKIDYLQITRDLCAGR